MLTPKTSDKDITIPCFYQPHDYQMVNSKSLVQPNNALDTKFN